MMKRYNKIPVRKVILALAIAVAIYYITTSYSSMYSIKEQGFEFSAPAKEEVEGAATEAPEAKCEMKAGTGLASSLLPKEVASQEDFGEFAPEDVLAGQNFLEPR